LCSLTIILAARLIVQSDADEIIAEHRLCNAAIYALRIRVERTFAWEDKFKRLLLRFERIQQRHYGMKLMAYTLINLRAFCGI